jgi:transcriptional regulator with XRE-family HTH domain
MTRLRAWRLRRRLSVAELALSARVLRETISDIEHGRRLPGTGPIARICAALSVAPHEVAEFAVAREQRTGGGDAVAARWPDQAPPRARPTRRHG